jgi:hypothetical protein
MDVEKKIKEYTFLENLQDLFFEHTSKIINAQPDLWELEETTHGV